MCAFPADHPTSAVRIVRPDRPNAVGRGAAWARRKWSRAPGNGAGTGGANRGADVATFDVAPLAVGAGFVRNCTEVRIAGGASIAGKGRPCITARKRAASSGTGAKGKTFLMIGGRGSPTGFMVRPSVIGVISGGDDRKLTSARTASNCSPAPGRPTAARAWLNRPPPLNTIPAALRAVLLVTPAVIVARMSAS